MRYDSHAACVRCVASAREGRLSLDVNRLLKKWRAKALKFWSQVDIAAPENAGTGMDVLILELNNHNLHGVDMGYQLPHSIILSAFACGLLGVILDIPVLKLLVAISIAAILFILSRKILESL